MRTTLRGLLGCSLLSVCFALMGCPGPNPLPIDGGRSDAPLADDARTDAPMMGDGGARDGAMPPGDGGPEDAPGADAPGMDASEPFCGDGVTNPTEDCDLGDLGLETCVTLGFDTGTLDCATDCTFDTSGCRSFTCGDGVIEGTEICDTDQFGKATCGSAGFLTGVLACASDCTLDTSGCRNAVCGDGMIEGTETCDGANFGGATCVSRGFSGGSLTCTSCAIVDSACTTCGNNTREGTEVCDGTDVGSATCASSGFRSGAIACASGCGALDTSGCSMGAVPTAGQIVVTEIMPDPATISDNDGEWFEVTNTASIPLELRDCVVSDNQTTPSSFTVTSSVVIPAGGYATFARTTMAGFTASYVYASGWSLANTADDEVRITCAGNLIDSVIYSTPATWGWASGRSTSLSPAATNATDNDSASNWCAGAGVYEATGPNLGTPGAANPSCGVVVIPEICNNSTDDDGDGAADCLDTDCAGSPFCVVVTPGLFFSEYVEGSGSNKALEIWNSSTSARDLTGCGVNLYSNGSSAVGATYDFTTTLAAGDVFVLCNSAGALLPSAVCDATSGVTGFNGDDALELFCGTTTLDVIGQIGMDPGAAWSGGGVSTLDMTLRPICPGTPDPIGSDAFDPSTHWRGLPVDTFGGLGTGSCAP